MSYNDTKVKDLILNKMTIERYLDMQDKGLIDDNQAYEMIDIPDTIDAMVTGDLPVGKSLLAENLSHQTKTPITGTFNSRITSGNNQEILNDEEKGTVSEVDRFSGLTAKQIVKGGKAPTHGTDGWVAFSISSTMVNGLIKPQQGELYVEVTYTGSYSITSGHKYYVSFNVKSTKNTNNYAALNGQQIIFSNQANIDRRVSAIITATNNSSNCSLNYIFDCAEDDFTVELTNVQVVPMTELGLESNSLLQMENLLGGKYYEYGLTGSNPYELISIGENLWNYEYFYNALKEVNPNGISYVVKDGRECIKITNAGSYHNKGIELYKDKFEPNVRYKLRLEMVNDKTGLVLYFAYTDGTEEYASFPDDRTAWGISEYVSAENKTLRAIVLGFGYNDAIMHININKFQMQTLDNPETKFIPYVESRVKFPIIEGGINKLSNGVVDEVVGERLTRRIGRKVFDGSEDGWKFLTDVENTVAFYIDNAIMNNGIKATNNRKDYFSDFLINAFVSSSSTIKGLDIYETSHLRIRLDSKELTGYNISWTSTQKINAFKVWLQSNPLTVLYQLAEPTITMLPSWKNTYLAYNYGREEVVDKDNKLTTITSTIKYYRDSLKQIETNTQEIADVRNQANATDVVVDDIIMGSQIVGKAMLATNIVNEQRIEVEDAFNVRITATNTNEIVSSIGNESVAEVSSIGGFSVKQMVKNGDFSDGVNGWRASNGTISVASNEILHTIGGLTTASRIETRENIETISGSKYYASGYIYPKYNNLTFIHVGNSQFSSLRPTPNIWTKISGIITATATLTPLRFYHTTDINYVIGDTVKFKDIQLINLTELGWDTLSVQQVEERLGNKFYPYGITNTKPKYLKSIGENLWDWKYFYDTLKKVDSNNISLVQKDGRECVKINNSAFYNGTKLYQNKFEEKVQYVFRIEGLYEPTLGSYLVFEYTDGSKTYLSLGGTNAWIVRQTVSDPNKTISHLFIPHLENGATYININKFQLQMLDNPETQFLPYTENLLEIPQVYPEWGMPSLPNGVRDEFLTDVVRNPNTGELSHRFVQRVGKVVADLKTSSWSVQPDIYGDVIGFASNVMVGRKNQTGNVISNQFNSLSPITYTEVVWGFSGNYNTYVYIYIKKSKLNTLNSDGFREWLSNNNVEIYYQLAEPIITYIPIWQTKYLAYNYGREEILDTNNINTTASTKIKYYIDSVKQIDTNRQLIDNLLARVSALESK